MEEYIYTNDYTTAPKKVECKMCAYDSKLQAKEDTKRDVTYFYECTNNRCKYNVKVG